MKTFSVKTRGRTELADITRNVADAVAEGGIQEGACLVYVPHTTCAVTINENADPDVPRDITSHLSKVVPNRPDFRHSEGNSDAHIKSSLLGCSTLVPVSGGRLMLGTWQALFLAEFDGPRTRRVSVQLLAGPE